MAHMDGELESEDDLMRSLILEVAQPNLVDPLLRLMMSFDVDTRSLILLHPDIFDSHFDRALLIVEAQQRSAARTNIDISASPSPSSPQPR